jgi:hypothetical protein
VVKQINYPASSIGHQNCKKEEIKNYSTEYSHVVPHHSTDSAINCLTAQIGRDAVGLVVYGRSSKVLDFLGLLTYTPTPFHQDQDQDQDLPSSIKHHPSSIIHHPSSPLSPSPLSPLSPSPLSPSPPTLAPPPNAGFICLRPPTLTQSENHTL